MSDGSVGTFSVACFVCWILRAQEGCCESVGSVLTLKVICTSGDCRLQMNVLLNCKYEFQNYDQPLVRTNAVSSCQNLIF
jgi:hypothetical protein